MIAPARASVRRFVRRFARMYGITDHAATDATPARGSTHRVIIGTVHAGHSDVASGSKMRSDQ